MGRASRETPVRLGEKLLHIRKALGLSQDGMLRRLGLAKTTAERFRDRRARAVLVGVAPVLGSRQNLDKCLGR